MIVIGLVGGIGSGKSKIADAFVNLYSATVIRADEIGHQVMLPKGKAYQKVIDLLGKQILDSDGFIDRSIVSQIVFSDSIKLEALNHIIHRIVFDKLNEKLDELRKTLIFEFVIVEAALLIVDEFIPMIDQLWYIKCNKALRIERLMNNRHMSRNQILRIMDAQPEDSFYETYASHIIVNEGTIENCLEQIYPIMDKLMN